VGTLFKHLDTSLHSDSDIWWAWVPTYTGPATYPLMCCT